MGKSETSIQSKSRQDILFAVASAGLNPGIRIRKDYKSYSKSLYSLIEEAGSIACQFSSAESYLLRAVIDSLPIIGEDGWQRCISYWVKRKRFPVIHRLVKETAYDRREIVISLVYCLGMSADASDVLLKSLPVRNNTTDTCPLYPLQYKEGFFRMLMNWNVKHGHVLGLKEAWECERKYEVRLTEKLIKQGKELDEEYLHISSRTPGLGPDYHNHNKEGNNSTKAEEHIACLKDSDKQRLKKYSKLRHEAERVVLAGHKKNSGGSSLNEGTGLTFYQQDHLQRWIVLTAHEARLFRKMVSDVPSSLQTNGIETIQERNRFTRSASERGTMYMHRVEMECACEDTIDDAIDRYFEESFDQTGESYWRAASVLIELLGRSGESYENHGIGDQKQAIHLDDILHLGEPEYVQQPVFSARNKAARSYMGIDLSGRDGNDEKKPFSFSLDMDEVRQELQRQTRNSVLISQLWMPAHSHAGSVFGVQGADTYANGSLKTHDFLTIYESWLEGKNNTVVGGCGRCRPPYLLLSREDLIRFGIAAGCIHKEDFEELLGFVGSEEFDCSNSAEYLVDMACDIVHRLPYKEQTRETLISTIYDLQQYIMVEEAGVLLHHLKTDTYCDIDKVLRACAARAQKYCLYQDGSQEEICLHILFYAAIRLSVSYLEGVGEEIAGKFFLRHFPDYVYSGAAGIIESGFLSVADSPSEIAERYTEQVLEDLIYSFEISNTNHTPDQDFIPVMDRIKKEILKCSHCFDKQPATNNSLRKFSLELWSLAISLENLVLSGINTWEKRNTMDIVEDEYIPGSSAEDVGAEERLNRSMVLWIAAGGIRHYSLAFFEKKYRLNHYRPARERYANFKEKNRWIIFLEENLEYHGILEDIAYTLEILGGIIPYLFSTGERDLFTPEEYDIFSRRLRETAEIVGEILGHIHRESDGKAAIQLNRINQYARDLIDEIQ